MEQRFQEFLTSSFRGYSWAFFPNMITIFILRESKFISPSFGMHLIRPSQLNICKLFSEYFCCALLQHSGDPETSMISRILRILLSIKHLIEFDNLK